MEETARGFRETGDFHAGSAPGLARRGILREARWGWADAICLRNAISEAVVVPSIGRLMQFQFLSQPGPLWVNPALTGQAALPNATEWQNFGGDKSWPAPQSDWPKVTGSGWPPPATFDSTPLHAAVHDHALELDSPVDAHYGMRMRRTFSLSGADPMLTVTTRYEKTEGAPVCVAVWVITQTRDAERIYLPLPLPLPAGSPVPGGYHLLHSHPPADLDRNGRLLSLRRDRRQATKIGSDATRLLWVGSAQMLRIDFDSRVAGSEYPDGGCSSEVYTNPDPEAYIELETLGPLHTLHPGQSIEATQRYSLLHRSHPDPDVDARLALAG